MLEMNYIEIEHINIFRSRTENEYINLSGHVLILSDRLILLASELALCMENITDVNVIGLINHHSYLKEFIHYDIDYLIIVGYLSNKDNYDIVKKLRCKNKKLKTVFWATIDVCIYHLCLTYRIDFYFDRMESVNKFMHYLMDIKDKHDYYEYGMIDNESKAKQLTAESKLTSYRILSKKLIKVFKSIFFT